MDAETVARMKEAGRKAMVGVFTYHDIQCAMNRVAGPHDSIYRAADRLLQEERRKGNIETCPDNKRRWRRKDHNA